MSPNKADKPPLNRFARQIDELNDEERGIAEGALVAARATFADFARVTAIAAVEARDGGVLNTADFHAIHVAIFGPKTLTQREFEQGVTYGVVLGDFPDDLQHGRQRGISGRSLPRRLREISADLRRAFEESDEIDRMATVGQRSRFSTSP